LSWCEERSHRAASTERGALEHRPDEERSRDQLPRRPNVLIVDDDPTSASVIARLFEQAGTSVTVRLDPSEAVGLALDASVDMVSLDLSMPRLDGFQALSLIRSHEQTRAIPRVPVLTITGAADARDRAASIAAGFVAHLVKPVQFESVQAALARSLRLRAPLYRSRYSTDCEQIVRGMEAFVGLDRQQARDAIVALAGAIESRGSELIGQMALGLYEADREAVAEAARRLERIASTVSAEQLGTKCSLLACCGASKVDEMEELVVRAKAELDRLVLTLREEVFDRLFI